MSQTVTQTDLPLHRYTPVGCYTLIYIDPRDCEVLCAKCAGEELAEGRADGFFVDVYWEGPAAFCVGCNCEIKSSYGDPDASEVEKG